MSDTTIEKDSVTNESETVAAPSEPPSKKHSKAYKAAQRQKAQEHKREEKLLRRASTGSLTGDERKEIAAIDRKARLQWALIFALLVGIAVGAVIALSILTDGTLMGRL